MQTSVDDQVLDFYDELFEKIFSEPFRQRVTERRRLNPVIRQVEESAEAASSSLTRFFLSQKLNDETVENILDSLSKISDFLKLEDISNPNVTTEEIVENLLKKLPCPKNLQQTHESIYSLLLYTVAQVLMLVGPVMAEWQKLNFSSTFELPRRVVNRLNEISEQINAQGASGQVGVDESYELQYRDYLLQRFHRVEVGTVRMTTNLDVDLRELFVMPNVNVLKHSVKTDKMQGDGSALLMGLTEARKIFAGFDGIEETSVIIKTDEKKDESPHPALEQVKHYPRNVFVGLPGVGKSTFFEWLQVKLASVEEKFPLGGGQQAIPLLIRVRQLDMMSLPRGAALIEKATASKDRANLMPDGWIDRQMKAGRVLFMLDGLDETETELRDKYLIPWLSALIKKYPKCHYLISSRPVGYPAGLLFKQKFVECDLLDFDEPQIREYTRHWCTSVRLARNEAEEEARREGEREGDEIVDGFREHPYIRNLARNPLMLSAICLINYFGGGKLPKDRALLYKLCVEGLLHNWDQRRGIHSEFSLNEKLRVSGEVALAMQMDNTSIYESNKVENIATEILGNRNRATKMLEYFRYRGSLLTEISPGFFAFAHISFLEYLASETAQEYSYLWQKEAIANNLGLLKEIENNPIEKIVSQPDRIGLSELIADTYFSSSQATLQNQSIRRRVIIRIALAPGGIAPCSLEKFQDIEVGHIANLLVGKIRSNLNFSEAFRWLRYHPDFIDSNLLLNRIRDWRQLKPIQTSELVQLLHLVGSEDVLTVVLSDPEIYSAAGPKFGGTTNYGFQGIYALLALSERNYQTNSLPIIDEIFFEILKLIAAIKKVEFDPIFLLTALQKFITRRIKMEPPRKTTLWLEFSKLLRGVSQQFLNDRVYKDTKLNVQDISKGMILWAELLENEIANTLRKLINQ